MHYCKGTVCRMQWENLSILKGMLKFSVILYPCYPKNAVKKHMHITVKVFQYVQRDYSHVTLNPPSPKIGGGGGGKGDYEELVAAIHFKFIWGGEAQSRSCTIAADSISRATFKTMSFKIVFFKFSFSFGQDTLRLIVTKFADSHYLIDVHHPQVRQVIHSQLLVQLLNGKIIFFFLFLFFPILF